MSLVDLVFGRRRKLPPVPAHVGSRIGKSGWWALADADQRALAGPFRDIGRAGEVADAISAGDPWRLQATD